MVRACMIFCHTASDAGVSMESFMRVMNEIDWNNESPPKNPDRS